MSTYASPTGGRSLHATYPATVARFKPDVKQVAMAYFGVQYLRESIPNGVDKALTTIVTAFGNDNGPGHWDRARYVDEAGFTNIISILLLGRSGQIRCLVRELRCRLKELCR